MDNFFIYFPHSLKLASDAELLRMLPNGPIRHFPGAQQLSVEYRQKSFDGTSLNMADSWGER